MEADRHPAEHSRSYVPDRRGQGVEECRRGPAVVTSATGRGSTRCYAPQGRLLLKRDRRSGFEYSVGANRRRPPCVGRLYLAERFVAQWSRIADWLEGWEMDPPAAVAGAPGIDSAGAPRSRRNSSETAVTAAPMSHGAAPARRRACNESEADHTGVDRRPSSSTLTPAEHAEVDGQQRGDGDEEDDRGRAPRSGRTP